MSDKVILTVKTLTVYTVYDTTCDLYSCWFRIRTGFVRILELFPCFLLLRLNCTIHFFIFIRVLLCFRFILPYPLLESNTLNFELKDGLNRWFDSRFSFDL